MRIALPTLAALAGIALGGCNTIQELPDPGDSALLRLSSCGELRDYASDVMLEAVLDSRYGYWGGRATDDLDASVEDSGSDAPSDFTTTNVQEEGVDELDIVKTDGTHIYVAQDRALHIVKSWPVEDSEKLATVELDGWIRGLFLKDDKVVVFHSVEDATGSDLGWGLRASIFDVSDRTAPVLTREVDVEGWLADGRMIDGDIYLVVNHYLSIPEAAWDVANDANLPEVNWRAWDTEQTFQNRLERAKIDARVLIRDEIDRVAQTMELSDWLPSWRVDGGDAELMHDCADLYRPSGVGQQGAMSVLNLDLDEGTVNATGLLSNGWQLYASKDNLYVAQGSNWWWWGNWDRELETHIHKFNLGNGGEPEYVASGEVRGWAYDQFAFSEHEGKLRVATTDSDWWGRWDSDGEDAGGNNLFVLEDNGAGGLDIIGEIDGIAPGERIFATRFFKERAFMVTFRQVDPLFAIDLTDPEAPKVRGELKIPGYSAYLHPMGPDHLLAVGMDGDDEGVLSGLAFNIFDVSDLDDPKLAHQYTLEGSDWGWSEALWDHHAFTYHRDVLTVPMFEYFDNGSWDENSYFSGSISLNATPEDGFDLVG
ncbi:MAG: beta-propeller domain-containing protein, partial [Myxococcota bacterium]